MNRLAFILASTILSISPSAFAQGALENWPVLVNPFPSTGGGGVMIDGYAPVVANKTCTTDFQALLPNGAVYPNSITFDAVETQGGILCTNGRWRAKDGSAEGTTPFQVFIKDGVVRRMP